MHVCVQITYDNGIPSTGSDAIYNALYPVFASPIKLHYTPSAYFFLLQLMHNVHVTRECTVLFLIYQFILFFLNQILISLWATTKKIA